MTSYLDLGLDLMKNQGPMTHNPMMQGPDHASPIGPPTAQDDMFGKMMARILAQPQQQQASNRPTSMLSIMQSIMGGTDLKTAKQKEGGLPGLIGMIASLFV